jgi:two-component sensor histidine kinase
MQGIDFVELFEGLPSPHMVIDRDFNYVAVNAAYERAVLRVRTDLIGRNLFDLFPNYGDGGRRLRASFTRVFEKGESDTLAYIGYDIPNPEGGFDKRYWTAVHVPLRKPDGSIGYLLQNTVDVTEVVRLREAASLPYRVTAGEAKLIERAREAEDAHRSLLAESAEFRRMFQQAPGFIAVLTGPQHVFSFANDAYVRLVGGRQVIGKTVAEALPEIEGQGFGDMLDRVYATGEPAGGQGMRIMLQREPDEPPRETFLDFSYDAIKDLEGGVTGIFVQGMDRTEAVRTSSRQRLLLDELNHRVKNTLATVQSIATQTLRAAPDLASAKEAFEARIMALSKAHNILSSREWISADLSSIVGQELAAHGHTRIRAGGPSVKLNPKASIAIAMVIHELSTNAAKYGALSVQNGILDVRWRLGEAGALQLDWTERGGPAASQPTRKGFGSRMVERVVRMELDGSFDCSYAPEGYSCELTIPAISFAGQDDLIGART